jgi:ribosomal small subunit protein bTHX
MGKGDKKSRRGKIILGSSGVRRPKSKKKAFVEAEAVPAAVVKSKKVAEVPQVEPKPKVKAAEPVAIIETDAVVAPQKTVKKAVKKTKSDDVPEKE